MPWHKLEAAPEYQPAWKELQELIGELQEFERSPREHGQIEQHLMARSHALMRALMQAYLDRLAKNEDKRERVLAAEGTVRRQARERCRRLMTVFGEVQVHRVGYSDRGTDSVFPLDAQLNLPAQQYSHGLQERLGEVVADASFEAECVNEYGIPGVMRLESTGARMRVMSSRFRWIEPSRGG